MVDPLLPHRPRLLRSTGAGLAVAALVVFARVVGALEGFPAVVVMAVVLLALPTSRAFSRRVLLVGAMLAGLAPLLWFAPLPTGGIGRTVLALALVSGGLAAWVAWDPSSRLSRIVPRPAAVDSIPVLATVIAIAVNLPWLRARESAGALSMLQAGWDNSAHFSMTRTIRSLGRTYEAAAPLSNGEMLKFTDYPQGFHALAASIMELTVGQRPESVGSEVVSFAHAVGLVATGAVALVAAAVCSIPAFRRRPAVSLPIVGLPVVIFVLGPGGLLVANGFINFYLSAALCVACAAIALQMPRVAMPIQMASLLGALLGVTYGWVLLLALAAPGALLVLFPLRAERWRGSRRSWVITASLLAAAAVAAVRAVVVILGQLDTNDVLVIDGSIPPPRLSLTAAVAVVAAVTALASGRGSVRERLRSRTTYLALVPLIGLMVALAIAVLQISETGGLSYYFWKFAYGLILVGAAVLAIAAGQVVVSSLPLALRGSRAHRRRRGVSVVLAAVLTQAFGLTAAQGTEEMQGVPQSPGIRLRAEIASRYASSPPIIHDLVSAADVASLDPTTRFYAVLPDAVPILHPLSVAQWSFALSGTWTMEANSAALPLTHLAAFPDDADLVIDQLLGAFPAAIVLTDADTLAVYLDSDRPEELTTRIRTW